MVARGDRRLEICEDDAIHLEPRGARSWATLFLPCLGRYIVMNNHCLFHQILIPIYRTWPKVYLRKKRQQNLGKQIC
jgi:hypothetical protein